MPQAVRNDDYTSPADPWLLFAEWLRLAEEHESDNPNAMALGTIGAHGMPSVRMVLLKGHDARGFTFYTNRQSAKGVQLLRHPKAAINFYWKSLKRQIRAEGPVETINDAESDAYFASRPRTAQIGAWASDQSRVLPSRAVLEQRVQEFEQKFAGGTVPRPPHWGGFRLAPLMMEFWQERDFRLHDRVVYHRADVNAAWGQERLYP